MVQKQQALIDVLTSQRKEVKVEGISLPRFYGNMGDSVELYFDQVIHYFEAKNIDWQDENQSKRIIAMMTANFRGNAAAWYMLCRDSVSDVQDLIQKLTKEFVPPDLQERLRDRLYSLKQKRCSSLEDYISRFRVAIMQVKDMSELDEITYFIRGLVSPTKEEVQYRRCTTVSEALSVALEYDRSHFRAEQQP
ncbi:Retroelement pol Polyprotein [Phytophthora cinnamomi]|uniref:Retroelement pol Polyprotein n=1 Tax=Phytophthora cinnamomi TaxID=4785 RepID=UPI00355AA699|nr:Retroelement pol Polyprotein [Phytophthora cinnamomi]